MYNQEFTGNKIIKYKWPVFIALVTLFVVLLITYVNFSAKQNENNRKISSLENQLLQVNADNNDSFLETDADLSSKMNIQADWESTITKCRNLNINSDPQAFYYANFNPTTKKFSCRVENLPK